MAFAAWWLCDPPSRLNLPDKLEQIGLEVVLRPNVDAVGARSAGY